MESLQTTENTSIRETTCLFHKKEIPALEVNLEAPRNLVDKYAVVYFEHHYRIAFRNGLFTPHQYKAGQVLLDGIIAHPLTIYLKVNKIRSGSRLLMMLLIDDDTPLSPLLYPLEYRQLKQLLQRFHSHFMRDYYHFMHELSAQHTGQLQQQIQQLEDDIHALPYRIAVNRQLVRKLKEENDTLRQQLRKAKRSVLKKKMALEEEQKLAVFYRQKTDIIDMPGIASGDTGMSPVKPHQSESHPYSDAFENPPDNY